MVNISMKYGTNGASAYAYGYCGIMLGPVFHRLIELGVDAVLAEALGQAQHATRMLWGVVAGLKRNPKSQRIYSA